MKTQVYERGNYMNVFLRRNKMGLESLRKIRLSTSNPSQYDIMNDMALRTPRGADLNYLFLWGYVRNIPQGFRHIFNKPSAVGLTSNKGTFRVKMADNGLTMPSWRVDSLSRSDLVDGLSYVVRPNSHYGGKNIHSFVHSYEEEAHVLQDHLMKFGTDAYISERIDKDKEYRVFTMSGKVVFMVEKIVDDTGVLAWNVEQGGRFENVNFGKWDLMVAKNALEAVKLGGLDFGAVDVMVKSNSVHGNHVYVLEVNTSPFLTADYWSSCVAKAFDYTVKNSVTTHYDIPDYTYLTKDNFNWKHFIHPAISDKAILEVV